MGRRIRFEQSAAGGSTAPIVASSTPGQLNPGLVTPITLAGVNFSPSAVLSISGAGVSAAITAQNAVSITANFTVTAAAAPGIYIVTVTNPDGQTATFPIIVLRTAFQDSFTTADEPFYLGNSWNSILTASGTPGVATPANLALAVNRTGGIQALFGVIASNLNGIQGLFLPALLDTTNMSGLAQFAEAKLISRSALFTDCGPLVFGNPNTENLYALSNRGTNADFKISRNWPAETQIGVAQVVALNDVVRLEVRPSAPSNDVRFLINGVLVDTVIDANAARPTIGIPGMGMNSSFTATMGWANFACGLL